MTTLATIIQHSGRVIIDLGEARGDFLTWEQASRWLATQAAVRTGTIVPFCPWHKGFWGKPTAVTTGEPGVSDTICPPCYEKVLGGAR